MVAAVSAEQSEIPMAGMADLYLSTETNFVPIRGVMREDFDMALYFPHTRTRIKAPWTARAGCLRTTTLGKNRKKFCRPFSLLLQTLQIPLQNPRHNPGQATSGKCATP